MSLLFIIKAIETPIFAPENSGCNLWSQIYTAIIISNEMEIRMYSNGRQGWQVCLIAGLFFLYELAQISLLNSIGPNVQSTLSLDATQLGVLSICYNIATIIMLIPVGIITDRYSLRKIICTAMSLSVLGTLLFAFSSSYPIASLSRFISGIGGAFAFVSCMKLASRWFPPHRMSLITGIFMAMAMLGGIIAQTPMLYLSEILNWRSAVAIFAIFGIIIIVINHIFIQDYPPGTAEKLMLQTSTKSILYGLKKSIKNRQNWLCGIYTSLLNIPVVLLGSLWGNLYLTHVTGFSEITASNIIVVMFLGLIVGSPAIGYISDSVRRRKIPMQLSAITTLLFAALITFMVHRTELFYVTSFFFLGFFSSGQAIGYPTISESNSPSYNGTALSLGAFLVMSGSLTRILFGRVLDIENHYLHVGSKLYTAMDYRIAIILLPAACFVAFIIASFIKETYAKAANH